MANIAKRRPTGSADRGRELGRALPAEPGSLHGLLIEAVGWKDAVRHHITESPGRTQAALARAVGCSPAQMSNIMNSPLEDPHAPVTRYVGRLVDALGLRGPYSELFRELVRRDQSPHGSDARRAATLRLGSLSRSLTARALRRTETDYIREDLTVAIRELARSRHFRPEARWIREQLLPTPSLEEVQGALALLRRLGFLDEGGAVGAEGVVVGDDAGDTSVQPSTRTRLAQIASHQRWSRVAAEALERFNSRERTFSGMTVLVPEQALPELRRMFHRWQFEWASYAEDHPEGRRARVYRLNLQFFPLTDWVEEASEPQG